MSNHIDKIIYINLSRRVDRKEHIENQLNSFNLDYERFEAIDMPNFGSLGCCYSHLNVLKLAKENNYKNILIFEDDFIFLTDKDKFESSLNNFFNLNIEYDVLMLSYQLLQHNVTPYEGLLSVKEAQTASGYIVNNHYYDVLINLYENSFKLLAETNHHWLYMNDQAWKILQQNDKWYCLDPRIGKQIAGYSDTSQKYYNYDC